VKKHLFVLALCLFAASILPGCAFSASSGQESGASADAGYSPFESPTDGDAEPDGSGVDLDLTVLSSTMAYSEVYNMMANPQDYKGKTIKVNGWYYASYNDETGESYHFVIVADAAACCQQGIEFVWNGPADYPENLSQIEITGVFSSYESGGYTYYYLAADSVALLD